MEEEATALVAGSALTNEIMLDSEEEAAALVAGRSIALADEITSIIKQVVSIESITPNMSCSMCLKENSEKFCVLTCSHRPHHSVANYIPSATT